MAWHGGGGESLMAACGDNCLAKTAYRLAAAGSYQAKPPQCNEIRKQQLQLKRGGA